MLSHSKFIFFLILSAFLAAACDDGKKTTTVAPPVFDPAGGTHPQGTAVTITTATAGAAIFYTQDGADPDDTATPYAAPILLQASTTIQAVAIQGGARSAVTSATYEVRDGLLVYFKRPAGWGTAINIYYWDTTPPVAPVIWPGVPMLNLGEDWYSYFLEGVRSANLIFNDGTSQTADLTRDRVGWYVDGQWYDEKPTDPIECPDGCGANAFCDDGVCACHPGYVGDPLTGCTSALDECTDTSCGANAQCISRGLNLLEGPRYCRCRHGFTGDPEAGCTAVQLQPLGDFREETIYFVLTARFYDGDPGNNYYCRDRYEAGDPHWRGDFKGLIERLDYIKDLGFTALWITPPIENRSGLDYHGYHGYDWYRIDPRLESVGHTYQDLIDAAHARGLKIIQDVVVNHSSQYGLRGRVWIDHLPIKYYVEAGHSQGDIDLGPYQGNLGCYTCQNREDNDNPAAPQWFRDRQSRDPDGVEALTDPLTGQSVPSPGYNPGRFFGIDAMTLDPAWYHLNGFMAGGDWENQAALQSKHMAGDTIDLFTEDQFVQDYLNEAIYEYLDMGVDALRVDTVKHVERGNLLHDFVDRWKAYRPGLFVFGENLVKGISWQDPPEEIRPHYYTWDENGNPSGFSVLDFSLMSVFRDSVANGNYDKIAGEVLNTAYYSDPTILVTFFQNHDIGPDNDWKYRFAHEQWKAAATYNLLWTVRGIPCLYYGEEVEFMKGAPQDIADEHMMVSDTGRAYFGDHLTSAAIAATQAHPLYQHIKRLNAIRRAVPALQKGSMSTVEGGGNNLSFWRDYNDGQSYVVVGLTIGSGQHFDVTGVRDGTYTDAVTGRTATASGGHLAFDVLDNSAGIYVLNGPGKIGQDGLYLR